MASWIESRWGARVAAGAVSALATAIVARPWSFGRDAVFAQGDTQFTLVSALHVLDALRDGRPWYAVPLSWPVAEGVLQSDWVAGAAVVGSPLFALGVDPARVHVWLVLGMLWATTFVAARAAAAWLGEGPAAWLAGIAIGLGPLQVLHGAHLNLVFHAPAVLAFVGAYVGVARGSPGRAAAAGLLAGLTLPFGVYLGLHALAAAAVAGTTALLLAPERRRWFAWAGLLAGAAVGIAPTAPVLATYGAAARRLGVTIGAGEIRGESWDLADTLRPWPTSAVERWIVPLWPAQADPARFTPDLPNPGWVLLALAVWGAVVAWRGRRALGGPLVALVALGAIGLVLALGPEVIVMGRGTGIPAPYALLRYLPGFDGLRAPARWLIFPNATVALLAAIAVRTARPRAAAAAIVAVLLDFPTVPGQRVHDLDVAPGYAAIDAFDAPGALLDEAVILAQGPCGCQKKDAVRAAELHGRPLVGGAHARPVPGLTPVERYAAAWYEPKHAAFLAAMGVRVVLDHPPLAVPPPGVRCEPVGDHQACLLPDATAEALCAGPWREVATLADRPAMACAAVGRIAWPWPVRGPVGPIARRSNQMRVRPRR